MQINYKDFKKAVITSQHCQRNWDLNKVIPEQDIEIFKHVVTNCPSKQNIAYYDVYFINNRKIIEEIHNNTFGFYIDNEYRTNSQVLANLVVAFVEKDINNIIYTTENEKFHRNANIDAMVADKQYNITTKRDKDTAIGIAAGYLNLTASILGYRTGCCACFNGDNIQKILNCNSIELLMGIGFADETRPRREHHRDTSVTFPSLKKQEINVKFL